MINYYEEDLLKYMSLEREREREKEYYSDLLFYLLVQEVYTSDKNIIKPICAERGEKT